MHGREHSPLVARSYVDVPIRSFLVCLPLTVEAQVRFPTGTCQSWDLHFRMEMTSSALTFASCRDLIFFFFIRWKAQCSSCLVTVCCWEWGAGWCVRRACSCCPSTSSDGGSRWRSSPPSAVASASSSSQSPPTISLCKFITSFLFACL